MTMPSAQSNPPWDEAEIILALDLYLNHESNTKHGSQAEFENLSSILRRLNIQEDIPDWEDFRNPNGVGTKIANLMFLDNDEPSKGLSGASKTDRIVWNQYHENPAEVHAMAESILSAIDNNEDIEASILPMQEEEEKGFPEGKYFYRMHRSRERNSKLIKQVKMKAEKEGVLNCSICGFDFEKQYGELGENFIECHHIRPISEYKSGDKTRASDLALVCPNCHRMLHVKRPWLKPDELSERITYHFIDW